MPARDRLPIHACTRDQLADRLRDWNQPAWRTDQLLDWLYAKRASNWSDLSNLPRTLRSRLAESFDLSLPTLARLQGSADATRKFLWRLQDGALIESVLIPANPALYGDRADRHTLCVSTQVGCAYGCRFCASGLDGWKRNLGPDEIVGQVLAVERWHRSTPTPTPAAPPHPPPSRSARLIDNLVIMGMGEPLANYSALLAALRTLNAPWGAAIGARKITVSTSGLAPRIRQLAAEPEQFRLAISLHGATDAVRQRIMPVNRKYPLQELTAACEEYLRHKGRMITLEYILLVGVNDDLAQVPPLAALARRLHAKVNLIPYNTVEGLPWSRPDDAHCQAFASLLDRAGIPTTLRLEKGHDIAAACGQLRLQTERESA
ncbi:MAG: 23S rRNA (adenine(2503)-C(2))-methyltransferase RlmN [Verrucomicrobiae bacterium]|nr:23S rRNA (adenine(2503)-C(2))-methyltransferase RlmN [Verrucomicrobiae bacterium]